MEMSSGINRNGMKDNCIKCREGIKNPLVLQCHSLLSTTLSTHEMSFSDRKVSTSYIVSFPGIKFNHYLV